MRERTSILAGLVILMLAALACNFPGQSAAPTPSEPTPNLTMTALFEIVTRQMTLPPPIPTATPQPQSPTFTPPPLPSATNTFPPPTAAPSFTPISDLRPAGKVTAAFLSTAPTLDGIWDEWKTTAYPMKQVVYGKENHTGKDDLEGSFRIGWDNTYLYLAVKVIDDKYVQNATGIDIFKGDSIELLLDVDLMGDLASRELNSDDYQLVISPGKGSTEGTMEAYLYYPTGKAGARTDVKIASDGGNGLYRVEAAIPWNIFGITPASGQQYGFLVSINDNDDENKNVQESMVSHVAGRRLTDPTTWALLTLSR